MPTTKKSNRVMLRFDKHLAATARAYLFIRNREEHWVPKSLCRNLVVNNKLGGHVQVPPFIYERIMGHEPREDEATEFVERHVPAPVTPVNLPPDEQLTR